MPERIRQVLVVSRRGRFLVGEPLFERGPQVALGRGRERIREGQMALVELGGGAARPLRQLGSPRVAADVIEALLIERGLERGFLAEVEAEAREASERAAEIGPARRDLISLATFTVDPATARDFDDAVSAERIDGGVRLWIHIADVAAHVRPGTSLEAEAYARATSTYVPGSVEPMLPHALSSGACSLAPGVERLAVTAEIELSDGAEARKVSFYRSRVRSDARLDYDQLDEIFAGRAAPPPAVSEPLELARHAAAVLRERRSGSSLAVHSTEPDFEFSGGEVTGARAIEQTEAHSLIEQLMILTNEQVALLLERRRSPTLYRVHEQPDPQRIAVLVEKLASLEVPTPALPDKISPTEAGAIAVEASRLALAEAERRGHGHEAYTSLVLRAMKPAVYTHRNLGHAGLGSPAYAHFTSPIRRYPDLIAHRALLAALGQGEDEPRPEHVREAGPHTSDREREAMRLERDADDVCAGFLLERELRERGWEQKFAGEVSGVVGAGAFIRFRGELAEVYEGFLPARRIRGDRFDLNEEETALVGRRNGRRVRLGDPVTVVVEKVEAPRGRVNLAPAVDGDERAQGRGNGSPGARRAGGGGKPSRGRAGRGGRKGGGKQR